MNEKTFPKFRKQITVVVVILSIFLVAFFYLSNCAVTKGTDNKIIYTLTPNQNAFTKTSISTSTRLPINIPIETPEITEVSVSPTSQAEGYFLEFSKIDKTQVPVVVSTTESGEEYLYKNALVTFKYPGVSPNGRSYLNLDNLNDNGSLNSDIILDVSTGTIGPFLNFYPTNFARDYFSGNEYENYESCITNFPAITSNAIDDDPSRQVETSKPYCVLTNEGRMAVVYYVSNSVYPNSEGNVDLSLVVTVYSKKALNIFTPAPTATPGPSATPTNRYSVNDTSANQAEQLDKSIESFIQAVANGDKNSVSEMLAFPLKIEIDFNKVTFIKEPEKFLEIYDQLFTDQVIKEISDETLDNNLRAGSDLIYLRSNHSKIYFTASGKISEIDLFY